jgi:hypothetical protein
MIDILLFSLVFLVMVPLAFPQTFGIPGTTQTIRGYDTELGQDPICWRSNASTIEGELDGNIDIPFPNPLIADFKLSGQVELLRECPALNYITTEAPPEFQRGERPRTGKLYYYKVSITLNLASLGGSVFVSDEGPLVAVQILLCKLGDGFCSPFIHEEANARLAAQGIFESAGEGESHGGTHTHSGFHFFKVSPEDGPIYNLEANIPYQENIAGDFFAVASVQMYIGEGETATVRYDMANALLKDQRLISYQDPADIKVVSNTVLIVSYGAIGIVALVILFLLVETIKNRNHQVLMLTQGYFLIVFLVAALVMTIASFLFEPKSDLYCNASFTIVLTSAQLLYAITLGRLWRINAVISPLLMKTLRQKKGWSSRIMDALRYVAWWELNPRRHSHQSPKTLRRQISNWQLGAVVAVLTLPQVVIQVLSLTLQPDSLTIQYNEDESQGRVMCDSGLDMKASLRSYGFWAFLLLVLCLLFMAHTTSQLPSLFNETKVIYESALFSIVFILLGLAVIVVTNDPATSPAVGYLVYVVGTLSIAANSSVRIMLPKLRMVWRDEKVVVSRLVSDHVKHVREADELYKNSSQTCIIVSGLTPLERQPSAVPISTHSTVHSNSHEVADEMVSDFDECDEHAHTYVRDVDHGNLVSNPNTEDMDSSPASSAELGRPKPRNKESLVRRIDDLPSRRSLSNTIRVKCDETPARRLVLKMVDLQEQLLAVNGRIMSGLAVSEEEWIAVRELTSKLGATFNDDVDFTWENNRKEGPALSPKKYLGSKELNEHVIVEETEEDSEYQAMAAEDIGN